MKQYVQTDLEADRQVASTLAELILGGSLTSVDVGPAHDGHNIRTTGEYEPAIRPRRGE